MIADLINNKKLNPIVTEVLEAEFQTYQFSLLDNHTLKYQKILD